MAIHHTGDVTSTTGDGIYAESSVAGDITITLDGGTVTGASGQSGVEFVAGASNALNNFGTVRNAGVGSQSAITGATSDETINNYGTIVGNVNLGGGTDAFNNLSGGIFNAGTTVNLGAGNTLTNAGNLSPGGTGTVQTTTLTGKLVQTGSGTFTVDIDEGAAGADMVTITGTADFSGTVTPNVVNISSDTGSVTIATAATLTSTAAALDSGIYDFSLAVQGGTQLLLQWRLASILDRLSGGTPNQRAIAAHHDAANSASASAALQALIRALLALDETELKAALNQLSPEVVSDTQIAALYASRGFANNLLSCKINGADTVSIIREGQCLWIGGSGHILDKNTASSQLGYTEKAGRFAGGVQFALNPAWRLGFGLGYQQSQLDTSTNASSDGETIQGGVALKYNPGPVLLAATLSGGHGWYDTTRPVAFTGFSGTASASPDIDVVNGGLRAAYVFGLPKLYAKPMFDATATWLRLDGYTEGGGGAANLSVEGSTESIYTLAPSLEVGTEWWLADGTLIRPFLRGGASWHRGNDIALSASFTGVPAGVLPFTVHTDADDVMGMVSAGLDVIRDNDTVLRALCEGRFGETTQSHAITLKFSRAF